MGDSNKPSNDAPWTDAEQSFFAGAPPEEPEAPGDVPRLDDLFPVLQQRPRRAIFAWLRSPLAAAWRTTTPVLGAASARARRQVSAAAAGFVAALSSLRVDRRRVVVAVLGVVVAAGLSAGVVISRSSPLTKAAPVQAEAPARGPAVAEAAPIAMAAPHSPADVRSAPAGVSHPRPPARRKPVPAPASSSASAPTSASTSVKRPLMTAFTDRESYWAHERQSPPVHSGRPLFSR